MLDDEEVTSSPEVYAKVLRLPFLYVLVKPRERFPLVDRRILYFGRQPFWMCIIASTYSTLTARECSSFTVPWA